MNMKRKGKTIVEVSMYKTYRGATAANSHTDAATINGAVLPKYRILRRSSHAVSATANIAINAGFASFSIAATNHQRLGFPQNHKRCGTTIIQSPSHPPMWVIIRSAAATATAAAHTP